MKILLIHSYYQYRGGEDVVFDQEYDLLKEKNEVQTLSFHNKAGLKGALLFIFSIWNVLAARRLNNRINQFRPDVIHIHNWHFASGPLIIRTAKKHHVPIVMTLHNYRLLCPSAILLYKGQIFTDSLKTGFPWKAIVKKVYRDSLFQTFWLAFIIWFHKKIKTWDKVDTYIALTRFSRNIFISGAFRDQQDKFIVKPNFVSPPVLYEGKRADHFLYVGRLSEEKGVQILLDAFRGTGYKLKLAGDGPLKETVLNNCLATNNIEYMGILENDKVRELMQQCTALVFPSIWYEVMPLTIIEAFSVGTPVIAAKIGAMEELIIDHVNGCHFENGNGIDMLNQIEYFNNLKNEEYEEISRSTLINFENKFSLDKNIIELEAIYYRVASGNRDLKYNSAYEC